MPLSQQAKDLLFKNRGKPIVGLIHKTTNEIVLAPCIPDKIYIQLDSKEQAIAGVFLKDDGTEGRSIASDELNRINALLETGHVPRFAQSPNLEDIKSSHEFLFEQTSNTKSRQDWGGFTVTLDCSGTLSYNFVSGAFNSPAGGKRMKGAEMKQELINQVVEQISTVVMKPKTNEATQSKDFIYGTPDKKRARVNRSTSPELLLSTFSGSLFYPDDGVNSPPALDSLQKNSGTLIM